MSFRLLTTRLFKHGRLVIKNYYKREIHTNILESTRQRNVSSQTAGNLASYAKYRSQGLLRFGNHARRLFVDNILNRVTNPCSKDLREQATKKLLYGDSAPFFALVGVSLASGPTILTKDDELEGVCWEIRDAISRFQNRVAEQEYEKKLDDELGLDMLDIGPPIAKGCSAVVYAAALKEENENLGSPIVEVEPSVSHNMNVEEFPLTPIDRYFNNLHRSPSDFQVGYSQSIDRSSVASSVLSKDYRELAIENIRTGATNNPDQVKNNKVVRFDSSSFATNYEHASRSETRENNYETNNRMYENDDNDSEISCDASIVQYPLALKMMFNYDIQSNAMAILKAMHKETVPAKRRQLGDTESWETVIMDQTNYIPPHPNIVEMIGVFCDQIPDLRRSKSLYPMALPQRLNPHGYGRNMSLFLLMKRYNCSLQEYLTKTATADLRTRILLFTQLLEAIAHLNRFGVAHRDIKSDNILIDLNENTAPVLVLSDFGCCIADKMNGLSIPYSSHDIDKGGNTALMAPEIITKKPGTFSILNYSKSDLWACGTIAYEIFGHRNPFYGEKHDKTTLRSSSYNDESLPKLNDDVPVIIRKLVENILQRNPSNRLSPDIAANVMQLYLWAPSSWLKSNANPSSNEILQWLLSLTTKILCEGRVHIATEGWKRRTFTEYMIISSFLLRAHLKRIRRALHWMHTVL